MPPGRVSRLPPRADTCPVPADALLTALPMALLVIDEGGVILDANSAAETSLNLSRRSIIGMAVEDAIGHTLRSMPIDVPFVAYDMDVVLPGQRHQRSMVMAAPIADRPGQRLVTVHAYPAGTAPIARRSSEARSASTAAGAAALLAHEIKNPLSGIRGAAQLLEATADGEGRELTRLIRDEVDRVAALIDRMEGFTDTRPLELSPQNIHVVLNHARDVAANGFARSIVITEAYDPSLPPVLGNRDALVQVLINLLKNAAEALGDAGGTVTLTTAYRHGVRRFTGSGERRLLPIEVCVIDDGPGAPSTIAQHLFDPFVSSKRAGRGLGLALVEKLVSDQGGIVEYAREAREGGAERTVFRLLLSRAPGA